MNTKEIEKLLLIIVIALVIETLITTGSAIALQWAMDVNSPSEVRNSFIYHFTKYVRIFSPLFFGLFIGYWLYSVSTSKRVLWLLLGVLGSWWSLVIYALYKYSTLNTKNT